MAVAAQLVVEADVALSRCAPSGPRSLTPVVSRTAIAIQTWTSDAAGTGGQAPESSAGGGAHRFGASVCIVGTDEAEQLPVRGTTRPGRAGLSIRTRSPVSGHYGRERFHSLTFSMAQRCDLADHARRSASTAYGHSVVAPRCRIERRTYQRVAAERYDTPGCRSPPTIEPAILSG